MGGMDYRSATEIGTARKAGVVAFSTAADIELGEYDDEPTVLFKTGAVPSQFEDG